MSSTPETAGTPAPATPPAAPEQPMREPTPLEVFFDRTFRYTVAGFGWLTVSVLLVLLLLVGRESGPQIQKEGLGALVSSDWNPNEPRSFGIYPHIMGTLYSS